MTTFNLNSIIEIANIRGSRL